MIRHRLQSVTLCCQTPSMHLGPGTLGPHALYHTEPVNTSHIVAIMSAHYTHSHTEGHAHTHTHSLMKTHTLTHTHRHTHQSTHTPDRTCIYSKHTQTELILRSR